jgi:N-acetylglucosaminyl-diphospho-decaprenol L-rhamnosyltransferase
MARVAVFVVAYFSAEEVAGLAASIRKSTGDHTIDIFVLDNSGDAGELARLGSIPEVDRLVPSAVNLGYGGGINALKSGLSELYDWYLVCNPDVRVEPDTIDLLIAAGARHPTAGLLGPRIFGSEGHIYPSARVFPSIRTGVGHAVFVRLWPANPWTRRYHRIGPDVTEDTEIDWLSGAFLLARPGAFDSVKGFDDNFFMYFEDVDLAFRLAKHGWRAWYIPAAIIQHSGAHSTRANAGVMRKVHHRSASRYLDKKYVGWWLAPVRWGLRFGLFIRREFFRN